ncbi:MAG: hypothetical protein DME02_16000 [Candidatus Rokuibacteriota bacterium]|jgi:hypothetical protein|nr:MAG: hypothetical protein DME02_16000 [Candidatus Rokubacteria bacterium]
MSWLDAYESYVIEMTMRDRAEDLRCAADPPDIEDATAPTDAIADAPRATAVERGLWLFRLARTSR